MTCVIAPPCDDGANISPAMEDSMTTQTRTRPVKAPAYYLGRPAAFWLAASARQSTTGKGEFERSPQPDCVTMSGAR
jgi:hypothetical protein